MTNIEFAYPAFFYALILLPMMVAWYLWKGKRGTATLKLSGFENIDERIGSPRIWLRHVLFVLRLLVVGLLIIVLARPQSSNRWEQVTTEGIDIVMCMDISGSMRTINIKPNIIVPHFHGFKIICMLTPRKIIKFPTEEYICVG